MKKSIIILDYTYNIILCFILVYCTGCGKQEKCKSIEDGPIPQLFETYFGSYREGNYWIYTSGNGLEKDSSYFKDFRESNFIDGDRCYVSLAQSGTFSSLALSFDSLSTFRLSYIGGNNGNGQLDFKSNKAKDISDRLILNVMSKSNSKEFIFCEDCGAEFDSLSPKFIGIYSQPQVLDNIIIDSVWRQGSVFFAPKYGIIQFTSPVSSSIFYLQKTNIK